MDGDITLFICMQMIETDEDKSKFEEIYQTYQNLMYYIAYSRLHHEQDAEDVVYHVFMKIAENIQKIEPVSPRTKQYVAAMVDNRVSDILRERTSHPTVGYNEALQNEASPMADGENLLVKCILKLPNQQRTVIWLKYYHGYSLREIAQMLEISLSCAQKIDQRAKKKLKELYIEEGGNL